MTLKTNKDILLKGINIREWNRFKYICDIKNKRVGESISKILKEYNDKIFIDNNIQDLVGVNDGL